VEEQRLGLGMVWRTPREAAFPVAPEDAFAPDAGLRVGGALAWAILGLEPEGGPRGAATIEPRRPPAGWRRGVPIPPAVVRRDTLFVVPWTGVDPLTGCHGDIGMLDPASLFADRDGHRLPGSVPLGAEAPAMLEDLTSTVGAMPVERRLRLRIAQIGERVGVGTAAGVRIRQGLTHVQWPLLVGASEGALAAAFEHLVRRGGLRIDGRSLVVPWEAWPMFRETREMAEG